MLIILIVFSVAYGYFGKNGTEELASTTDNTVALGTLDYEPPCYQIKCKTFQSELGFSFQYPEYMEVIPAFLPGDNYRLALAYKDDPAEEFGMIIISVALNDENMTPAEWLLGPTSSFDPSKDYYESEINGQKAVQTKGGMWNVVNTPNNVWRLSIADLTTEGKNPPFSEMGIVVNSFKFNR